MSLPQGAGGTPSGDYPQVDTAKRFPLRFWAATASRIAYIALLCHALRSLFRSKPGQSKVKGFARHYTRGGGWQIAAGEMGVY
ncbi:MAG: hypothetical protein A2218_08410 [Elusimicrobia bacterium RIFOXYA2_FULL_53_38]|nr:MAG: hypothetical protein A2218_08410 [Elusimicrobia bacterium RIFOXYA2_FULL_53_38]